MTDQNVQVTRMPQSQGTKLPYDNEKIKTLKMLVDAQKKNRQNRAIFDMAMGTAMEARTPQVVDDTEDRRNQILDAYRESQLNNYLSTQDPTFLQDDPTALNYIESIASRRAMPTQGNTPIQEQISSLYGEDRQQYDTGKLQQAKQKYQTTGSDADYMNYINLLNTIKKNYDVQESEQGLGLTPTKKTRADDLMRRLEVAQKMQDKDEGDKLVRELLLLRLGQ
jgi:hypothetical protein